MHTNTAHRRAGIVWLISAFFLFSYATAGLSGVIIPGVEQLVAFMSQTSGVYIYGAAFLAILLEGTYLVGSFIPGTTLLTVLAILSQAGGPLMFLGTVATITVGWCIAGAVNIYLISRLARTYTNPDLNELSVKDNVLMTWYPAFRANYEVAQVAAGLPRHAIFASALRVRLLASSVAALITLIIPVFVDIRTVSNEEGFVSVLTVATICAGVAITHFYPETKILSRKILADLYTILKSLLKK